LQVRALSHLPFLFAVFSGWAKPRRTPPIEDDAMSDKLRWTKRLSNFFKDVRAELKKVTWPSRQEVYSTTIVVIAATIFFGFYLFLMDVVFSWVLSQIKSFFG
jgi:preprotein translocase subunit SecE